MSPRELASVIVSAALGTVTVALLLRFLPAFGRSSSTSNQANRTQ